MADIQPGLLVPLFHVSIQPAFTPVNSSLKMLLIGHRGHVYEEFKGNGVDVTPYHLSRERVIDLFGRGSMLHAMYEAARAQSPWIEIWGIAPSVDVGAVAATATINVKSNPRDEAISFQLGGQGVGFVSRKTDTRAATAQKLKSAINSRGDLPVRARIDPADLTGETVLLTCKWKGVSGHSIKMERNAWGVENEPAVRLLSQANFAGGIGAAGIGSALAAIGDEPFDVFVSFSGGSGRLDELDDFLDDEIGRWSTYSQLYGHGIAAGDADFATHLALIEPRNGPHVSYIATTDAPQPPWIWASAWGGVVTREWIAPPGISMPLQTLELFGIVPPRDRVDAYPAEDRQSLLERGISTWKVAQDGSVRIERMTTTYKRNAHDEPDGTWRDANTMFQSMYFVRQLRARLTSVFGRAALTEEETGIRGFTSPPQIKREIIHFYREMEAVGLVENTDLFATGLEVVIDPMDANRVNILMRYDVVNQLRILATIAETHLRLDPIDVGLEEEGTVIP